MEFKIPGPGWRRGFWDDSQRYLETGDDKTYPSYHTYGGSLMNIASGDIALANNIFCAFLSFQNARDELDGTLGLAAVGRRIFGNQTELEPASRYWQMGGTFAISFVNDDSAVLQFGVDGTRGDTSKYADDSGLQWYEPSNSRDYVWWVIRVEDIVIGPPGSKLGRDHLLPNSGKALRQHWLGSGADYSRPELQNSDDIEPTMILDSASLWTRLHPLLVDHLYSKIPATQFYNSTFYIPCDIDDDEIPEIGFTAQKQGWRWHYRLDKRSLPIQSYRHPYNGKQKFFMWRSLRLA
ncbi:hypothetical protein TWF281_003865 [Arthrobotrys megalospora]